LISLVSAKGSNLPDKRQQPVERPGFIGPKRLSETFASDNKEAKVFFLYSPAARKGGCGKLEAG
jgi:hypothetical protein